MRPSGIGAILACALGCGSMEQPGRTTQVDASRCVDDAGAETCASERDSAGPGCRSVSPGPTVPIVDSEVPGGAPASAWTEDGIVVVWPRQNRAGYRATLLDPEGATSQSPRTLWPDTAGSDDPRLAVSGNVLAIAEQTVPGEAMPSICRIGLVELPTLDTLREPARFSDLVQDGSPINEAANCEVAGMRDGFLVVWQHDVWQGDTDLGWSVFGQRLSRNGEPVGERLTLGTGGTKPEPTPVTSDRERAFVLHDASSDIASLTVVDATEARTVSVPRAIHEIAYAHGGLLARSTQNVLFLEPTGEVAWGPVDVGSVMNPAGPLGEGYVLLHDEEFLVATAFDSHFSTPSDPSALGENRDARPHRVVFAPDGSSTGALYYDAGLHFVPLTCGTEPPAPLGPPVCRDVESLAPLDDGCDEPVCYAIIRLDFLTLGLRGFATVGASVYRVDAAEAGALAARALSTITPTQPSDVVVSPERAGVFTAFDDPSDFGGFALVGAESGVVLVAGGIVWAGRGQYSLPGEWRPATDLACGQEPAPSADSATDPGACADEATLDGSPSADDALATALRTNLALAFAQRGPVAAFSYLYAPTVGGCDVGVAEYVIVLSQRRSP